MLLPETSLSLWQSGNVGQVDYSAQIKQAMDAGDSQAVILAILNQSAANNQQA